MADGRLPVELLGGFLGSGKTTLLRQRYGGAAGERTAVLVNEFGEIPLDQRVAAASGSSIRVIAGGCVCCDRRAELVQALRDVVAERDAGAATERVVIETSGVADPAPVVAAIAADPMLRHRCSVDQVTVTVDALAGRDDIGLHPALRRQIAIADELVLTKADLVAPEALELLASELRTLGSAAPIRVAVGGVIRPQPSWPASSPEAARPAPVCDEPAPSHGDTYSAVSISSEEPLDWDSFAVWLSMLLNARGDDVPRMKGIARVAGASPVALNSVGRTVHPPEHLADGEDAPTQLVFITRGVEAGLLERSLAVFQGL